MSELAKALRTAADMLNAEANKLDPPAPAVRQVQATGQNIFSGSVNPWEGHVPSEFQNPSHPYGARADIGSPGNQYILREYARRDGKEDRNAYVKDRGFKCIWPDTKQNWEQ